MLQGYLRKSYPINFHSRLRMFFIPLHSYYFGGVVTEMITLRYSVLHKHLRHARQLCTHWNVKTHRRAISRGAANTGMDETAASIMDLIDTVREFMQKMQFWSLF